MKNEGYKFEFDLIEGIPYEENLNRKRKADILIDDVDANFTKFHNSSLEAACFGAISLTNYSGEDYPFIKTDINTLKETLIYFFNNPEKLKEEQQKIVNWRKEKYTPTKLLEIYEDKYLYVSNLPFTKTNNEQIKENIIVEPPIIKNNPEIINIENPIKNN